MFTFTLNTFELGRRYTFVDVSVSSFVLRPYSVSWSMSYTDSIITRSTVVIIVKNFLSKTLLLLI